MEELLEKLEDIGAEVDDAIDRFMGDDDMYVGYVKQFPDNENVQKVKDALAKGDDTTAEHEIHTFKGVVANLGFLPLFDASMDVLMALREGKHDDAVTYFADVEKIFQEFVQVIQSAS